MQLRIAAVLCTLLLSPLVALAADPGPAAPGPAEVVQAFNRAITGRDLAAAASHMAKGSVQYTLRSAHAGVGTGAGITSDLATHWNTIGPVVLSATSAYKRVPEIANTRIDGDLATVWTKTTSETVDRSGKSKQATFSELYLLVKTASGWQIGAIADNRGTSPLPGAPGAAPAR